ncbi:MAG TPA: hypothetical protein DCX07_00935, partial [Phycisphaerales bacterium]|nr:hypothetical protein [Phycisphaerales bacterium]
MNPEESSCDSNAFCLNSSAKFGTFVDDAFLSVLLREIRVIRGLFFSCCFLSWTPWTMIARIAGRLEQVGEGTALVDAGAGLWYEVLVPAFDVDRLARRVGQDVVLHTIHYHEGDPSHGAVTPRLLGFLA